MPEITGLLLAAGKSRRFGRQKLLAKYYGQPLVLHGARALSNCDHVIAIINEDDVELLETLQAAGVETRINRDAHRGMGNSIACGVRASSQSDGWCILPADMPRVRIETVDQVYAALSHGAAIAAPTYQGQRGHPVGFDQRFSDTLQGLDGDSGARSLLQQHPGNVLLIETDDSGILLDIDTPEDLERARIVSGDPAP